MGLLSIPCLDKVFILQKYPCLPKEPLHLFADSYMVLVRFIK